MGVSCSSCLEEGSLTSTPRITEPLRLRVDISFIRESWGALICPFSLTDEMTIEAIEPSAGLEPLCHRYTRFVREQGKHNMWSAKDSQRPRSSSPRWPTGPRWSLPQRYARARIGGCWFLLQVAVDPEHRTQEYVRSDIQDAHDAASYADKFNTFVVRSQSGKEDVSACDFSMPRVLVCAPVGCTVLGQGIRGFVNAGEKVLLSPYPCPEVKKFVFDGNEEFLELPHAYFHHSFWSSGGRELICDLQGSETEDGDLLLVDPVMLRAPRKGIAELLMAPLVDAADTKAPTGELTPGPEAFSALHPRCGQLCSEFDPHRRGAKARHAACGGCGVIGSL